ncbi:MAG TPA: hypothetical protein ENI85_02230 [Deltaproteobacteria bacterium]|nr:hypothetical protein [Deltaproteobacteria bacterium]
MTSSRTDPAARGPFPVGVLQIDLTLPEPVRSGPDGPLPAACQRVLPTEIWYPAQPDPTATEEAPHPLGVRHPASIGLAPIAEACPLIAFSHGNSGLRQQSTFLTTHLASWGNVVVAPDHVGNTFWEMAALPDEPARQATHRWIRGQRPLDLHGVIRVLLDPGSALRNALPPLDPDRLGLLGHSFGGWTVLKVPALEPRVRAVCCLAPAAEPFVGRRAFASGELPLPESVEVLVLAARDDVLVDLETSILPLCERLGPRSRLEVVDRADHFHFCDAIGMLHTMHENNPRPDQPRPTRPLAELRSEIEMHALLRERVSSFFAASLAAPTDRSDRPEPVPAPDPA